MNAFASSVAKVLQGTLAAQGIAFLALPLLSRLFAPEAFGHFQLFQSIVSVFVIVGAFRYEVALLRPTTDRDYAAVFCLCLAITACITAVVTIVYPFVTWVWPRLNAGPAGMSLLVPLGVLLGATLQTLTYVPLRQQQFGVGALAKVAQSLGYVVAGVGLGLFMPFAAGLIVADLAGRAASIAAYVVKRRRFGLPDLRLVTRSDMARMARQYREFPVVAVPGALIATSGAVLTSLLMYSVFDAAVSGQYGLVERSVLLPVGMLAGAVAQVFTATLSASLRSGGADSHLLFRRIVRLTFQIAIVPVLGFAFAAPWLFVVLFGPTWLLAGELAQIMAPLLLAVFVMTPVNMTVMLLGYQRTQVAWETSRLLLLSLAWLVVMQWHLGPKAAIALHVGCSVLVCLAYLLLADTLTRRRGTQGLAHA